MEKISDRDFRTALTQAYWHFNLAIDFETAARMRRQRRLGVAGATSRAEVRASARVEQQRGEIMYLLGGLLGLFLPADNAVALVKAKKLCREAKETEELSRSLIKPKLRLLERADRPPE